MQSGMLLAAATLLLLCLLLGGEARKFNYYKSYKDAKEKPKNYGTLIKRDHPISEYLSSDQLYMLRKRKGPDQASNMFDASWSGKDGGSRRLITSEEVLSVRDLSGAEESSGFLHRLFSIRPPEEFSQEWWVFATLLASILLVAFAFLSMLWSLSCMAIRLRSGRGNPAADDEEKAGTFDFECVQDKDMDA